MTPIQHILAGVPYPLGATWDGGGTNFAIFSDVAEQIELCLFDEPNGALEVARITLTEQTEGIWHCYLPTIRPGQLYGYRIHGPFDPDRGLRCDPQKLLIDPYALAITGSIAVHDDQFNFPPLGHDDRDRQRDGNDSGATAPKSVVVDRAFTWGDDRPPRTDWSRTVIYEAHVRGFTALNHHLPESLRGTYAGLADERVVRYLCDLGVTAIELLPVHQFMDDWKLIQAGLSNYWGYNTLGFFAPHGHYAATGTRGEQVAEFKSMVRTLHRAGLEVLLDVVYNHTAEYDQYGPTVSFRGLDNQTYYHLQADDPRRYIDTTGCGNTVDLAQSRTLQLVLDSLRYWVEEMHVDGFRFDLAPALTRGEAGTPGANSFLDVIAQDPVLARVKLIAEPWDVGANGYQLGRFPIRWAEWNDRYRDTMRRFWRGDAGQVTDIGYRLTGSNDIFAHNGRGPQASINFVTAHDGFTLRDLVSYSTKHNWANNEQNRDGTDHNYSVNYGVEGPTTDPGIAAIRLQQMRNQLATLAISQGVPMFLHGDEIGRTQDGNNNAYCQDNPITWQSWEPDKAGQELLAWTKRVIAMRRNHPLLRRRDYFHYRPLGSTPPPDILWIDPDGTELSGEAWSSPHTQTLGIWLNNQGVDTRDPEGQPEHDKLLLILLNASEQSLAFTLPLHDPAHWSLVLDSARPATPAGQPCTTTTYPLAAHSLVVLSHPAGVHSDPVAAE